MDEKIAPYQALRRSKQDEIARRVQIHQSKISSEQVARTGVVRFLDMMGNVFPKPLPRRLRDTQFIYFDKLFNPIEMGSQGIFGNPLLAVLRSKGLVT